MTEPSAEADLVMPNVVHPNAERENAETRKTAQINAAQNISPKQDTKGAYRLMAIPPLIRTDYNLSWLCSLTIRLFRARRRHHM
jgi:hypothetical protein